MQYRKETVVYPNRNVHFLFYLYTENIMGLLSVAIIKVFVSCCISLGL
jgi:hypothetical protein